MGIRLDSAARVRSFADQGKLLDLCHLVFRTGLLDRANFIFKARHDAKAGNGGLKL
jgi:hypothetical protein